MLAVLGFVTILLVLALIMRASRRFVSIYGSFESSLFLIKAM